MYETAPLADVALCAQFNIGKQMRLIYSPIIAMAENGKERQAAIMELTPRIGFVSEAQAIAEAEAKREARFLGQKIHGKGNI